MTSTSTQAHKKCSHCFGRGMVAKTVGGRLTICDCPKCHGQSIAQNADRKSAIGKAWAATDQPATK